jgi:hypothetical protein
LASGMTQIERATRPKKWRAANLRTLLLREIRVAF